MKRQLSSFDFYVISSELKEFIGNHIEKIYQINRNDLIIKVKNIKKRQKNTIFIRNGEFITITNKKFETPLKPTNFVMTLRKYISNGVIAEINQYEFDRILEIKINKGPLDFYLIFEFFSKGNIIILDSNKKIILPLIKQKWASRTIRGREIYNPPPSQINPFNLKKIEFIDLLNKSKTDLVRTLAVNINLSGSISEEICYRAKVDKNIKIKDIDDTIIDKVFNALNEFLIIFKNKDFKPVIIKKEDIVIDVIPFFYSIYENNNYEEVNSFVRSLDMIFDINKIEDKKDTVTNTKIGKLNRQYKQQKEIIEKFKKDIDLKKIEGDVIYLNYDKVKDILFEISNILDEKDKIEGIKNINEKEIVKEFSPIDNLLIVNLKDEKGIFYNIKLDFRKTVAENAEKAYNDSKKFRDKLKGAQQSIVKTQNLIENLIKEDSNNRDRDKKLKNEKRFWFERFRWFISSNGNIVLAGKDSKTNDIVVKKYLKNGDRYAHAEIQGAPSCVIKSEDINGNKIPINNDTLIEACIFSACYSKAWKQFTEIQSYWVLPEQVSKTPQSGEFVPKGAFIIRGKRNYVKCKLEVAIGEAKINDIRKIVCGPINAVKEISNKYIILNPGNIKKNLIAHELAKIFEINVDEINKVLPPGGVNIIDSINLNIKLQK